MNGKWSPDKFYEKLSGLQPSMVLKMKNFSTAQQALSLALLEAKPLGICKTTSSTKERRDGETPSSPNVARET